jgi:hypothetical protein
VLAPAAGAEPLRGGQISRCLVSSATLIGALASSGAADPETRLSAWAGRESQRSTGDDVQTSLLEERAV